MKRLLVVLCVLFWPFLVQGANPSYEAFLGTNGIVISSNPPQGRIIIDGRLLTNGFLSLAAADGIAFGTNNGTLWITNIFAGGTVTFSDLNWTNEPSGRIRPVEFTNRVEVQRSITIGTNSAAYAGVPNSNDLFFAYRDITKGERYGPKFGIGVISNTISATIDAVLLHNHAGWNVSAFDEGGNQSAITIDAIANDSGPTLILVRTNTTVPFGVSGTNITLHNVQYTFPQAQGAAGTVLTNDGAGVLGWGIGGVGSGNVNFSDLNWTNDNGTLRLVSFPTNVMWRVVVPDDGVGTNFYFDSQIYRTNAASKLFAIYNGGSNAVTVGPHGGLFMGRNNEEPFPGAVLYGIFDTAIGETNQQEIFIMSQNSAVGYNGAASVLVDTNYGALILYANKEGGTKFARLAFQAGAGENPQDFNTFTMQGLVDGSQYFLVDPNFTTQNPTNYLFSSSVRITNTHTLLSLQNSNFPVLEVDGVGDLRMIKKVPYLWPSANATGALTNDGSGTLGWDANLVGGGTNVINIVSTNGTTNFINLSVQAAKLPNVDSAIIDAGFQAWQTIYPKTNNFGVVSTNNATWQFMVPPDYATNSLRLLINYSLINTNGPNTSNVVWGVSALSIRSGTTNNVNTNLFGAVVKGSNDWIGKYDGTNIVTNLVVELGTSAGLLPNDLAVIKLARYAPEETYQGAVAIHGLRVEYTNNAQDTIVLGGGGGGGISNLFSPTLSNATIKPLVVGVGDAAGATNTTGEIRGLEAGANITLTPNGSNYVIAATGGSGALLSDLVWTNTGVMYVPVSTAARALRQGFTNDGTRWAATNVGALSVAFGSNNAAGGFSSSILGGTDNAISTNTFYSIIAGGDRNTLNASSGGRNFIGGGQQNFMDPGASNSVIVGGFNNRIYSDLHYGSILGGSDNQVRNLYGVVVGGVGNDARSTETFVGGGDNNVAGDDTGSTDVGALVVGGSQNTASAAWMVVGGGMNNGAGTGDAATNGVIAGGLGNFIAAIHSTISGGALNTIGNLASAGVIAGGFTNIIDTVSSTDFSFISGGMSNRILSAPMAAVMGSFGTNTTPKSLLISPAGPHGTNQLHISGTATTNIGPFEVRRFPGGPDATLKLWQTNSRGYTEFTVTNSVIATNRIVWSLSSNTVAADDVITVHSTTIADGINNIVVTNKQPSVVGGGDVAFSDLMWTNEPSGRIHPVTFTNRVEIQRSLTIGTNAAAFSGAPGTNDFIFAIRDITKAEDYNPKIEFGVASNTVYSLIASILTRDKSSWSMTHVNEGGNTAYAEIGADSPGGTIIVNRTNGVTSFAVIETNIYANGVAYTFPSVQGAAQTVLTNDGSGNLGWGAASGGAGEANTASSLGNGFHFFSDKSGVDLRFNTLSNLNSTIHIVSNANVLHLAATNIGASQISDAELLEWSLYSTNLFNPRQGGSLTLTNLSGTGAITNLFSATLSNATIKPLVVGVGNVAGATNTTGEIRGLEAGGGVTITPNGSNYVIAATGGSALVLTNQLWVELTGNDSTGARNEPSKPFRTMTNAMAAALAGDTINVGVGRFTNLAGPLTISQGVTVRGLGWTQTALLGTNGYAAAGVNFKLSDNCTIEHLQLGIAEDLTIQQGVFGNSGTAGFTNVTMRNVRFTGFSDNGMIVTGASNPAKAAFIDCEFDSGGDMNVMHGSADSDLTYRRCLFYGHTNHVAALNSCAYRASTGNATFEFCNFASTNNGPVVKAIDLISTAGARVESSTFNMGCTSGNVSNLMSTSSRPLVLVNCLVTTNSFSGYVLQEPAFVQGVAAGAGITITTNSSAVVTITGGGGSPGGTDMAIQFNQLGSTFAGTNRLYYDRTNESLISASGAYAFVATNPATTRGLNISVASIVATGGDLNLNADGHEWKLESTDGSFYPDSAGKNLGNATQRIGTITARTLEASTSLTIPAIIATATVAQTTNLTEWRATNGTLGLAISSNGLHVISGRLDLANAVAFRTNQIDLKLNQYQAFTESLKTNLVLQVTNATEGVRTMIEAYGAGRLGGGVTNAWQLLCTAPTGYTLYWPPGTTNGNYDVLVNSNQVVAITLIGGLGSTNILASYRVFEGIGAN